MKRKEMIRLLEWNLNFGSYDETVPADFVRDYIEGFDVVILTEVRANEALKGLVASLGYDCIVSEDEGPLSNQILIAADRKFGLEKVCGKLKGKEGSPVPDFLHGRITVGGKPVHIVGTRVKIRSFAERFMQMKLVTDYVSSLEGPVIGSGDANSGQIRGDGDACYSSVSELYRYRTGTRRLSELRHYNFHLIRELLGERFRMSEPVGEEDSWGLFEYNGHLVCGSGNRLKNDILFYSDDIRPVGSSEYSWKHARDHEKEYVDMLIRNWVRRGNHVDHGCPDHARLMAKLAV